MTKNDLIATEIANLLVECGWTRREGTVDSPSEEMGFNSALNDRLHGTIMLSLLSRLRTLWEKSRDPDPAFSREEFEVVWKETIQFTNAVFLAHLSVDANSNGKNEE